MDSTPSPSNHWDISPGQFPHAGSQTDRLRFLVHYAVLAPSTRNTQPWQFRVRDDSVEVFLDLSRWQRVADADQREMHISIGCALENLAIAAAHFGYRSAIDCMASCQHPTQVARIRLIPHDVPPPAVGDPRFAAITRRQTNHGVYDGRPLTPADREAIAGITVDPGLRVDWIDDEHRRRALDDLVTRADALLFSRADFRQELGQVIGSGAFGTPWLLATLGRFAVSHLLTSRLLAGSDRRAMASSPVFGIISAHADTREAQLRVGQVLERLYLEATLRGVSVQPISQPLETDETRTDLAALLPEPTWHPMQPFRVGYAKDPGTRSPRRPLQEVLI
jgi:nitroreductase